MAVPTIVGVIKKIDDTAYVGQLRFYRMVPAMFNGTSFVVLNPLLVTTNSSGEFSTAMQPGVYEVETVLSKYPNAPFSRIRFRVPNSAEEINFSDLELETGLPQPDYFGGDPVGGGEGGAVSTATTSTEGIVRIDQTDANPIAITKKTITGSDEKTVLFRPVHGSIWIKDPVTLLYHSVVVATFGGGAQVGCEQVGVEFEDLPTA